MSFGSESIITFTTPSVGDSTVSTTLRWSPSAAYQNITVNGTKYTLQSAAGSVVVTAEKYTTAWTKLGGSTVIVDPNSSVKVTLPKTVSFSLPSDSNCTKIRFKILVKGRTTALLGSALFTATESGYKEVAYNPSTKSDTSTKSPTDTDSNEGTGNGTISASYSSNVPNVEITNDGLLHVYDYSVGSDSMNNEDDKKTKVATVYLWIVKYNVSTKKLSTVKVSSQSKYPINISYYQYDKTFTAKELTLSPGCKYKVQALFKYQDGTKSAWSGYSEYVAIDALPAPSVSIDGIKITAEMSSLPTLWSKVRFSLVSDKSTVLMTKDVAIGSKTRTATYTFNDPTKIGYNTTYYIRAKGYTSAGTWDDEWSEWSSGVCSPLSAPSAAPTVELSDNDAHVIATMDDLDTSYNYIQFRLLQAPVVDATTKKVTSAGAIVQTSDWLATTVKTTTKSGTTVEVAYITWTSKKLSNSTEYVVQARGKANIGGNSDWSDYSEVVTTRPDSVAIKSLKAANDISVVLFWDALSASNITYIAEYTDDDSNFDKGYGTETKSALTSPMTIDVSSSESDYANTWYFRLCAVSTDSSGNSVQSRWSAVKSIALGHSPDVPTTWSSGSTISTDENDQIILYWAHNTVDGSDQTKAHIQIRVRSKNSAFPSKWADSNLIEYDYVVPEGSKEPNIGYLAITSAMVEEWISRFGDIFVAQWRVKTQGYITTSAGWSEYGTTRSFNILDSVEVTTYLLNNEKTMVTNGSADSDGHIPVVLTFPCYAYASVDTNDTVVGYLVKIIADSSYSIADSVGNTINVVSGQTLYEKYVSSSEKTLYQEINVSDIRFKQNADYTLVINVSTEYASTGSGEYKFSPTQSDELSNTTHIVNANVAYDENNYTCKVKPYWAKNVVEYVLTTEQPDDWEDMFYRSYFIKNGDTFELVEEDPDTGLAPTWEENTYYYQTWTELSSDGRVDFNVYRTNYDGSFTLVGSTYAQGTKDAGIVLDSHPSLDLARYRVVAIDHETGALEYADINSMPVNESAIIIQWNDNQVSYDINSNYDEENPSWSGSLLRLPYDIDVSEENSTDVKMLEYAGREHPVSYYGTHLGTSATWKTDIIKSDTETLYQLRRLAVWMGDCYVREPSGLGYWAHIKVSISQTHNNPVVPVTLNLTRVEGGE